MDPRTPQISRARICRINSALLIGGLLTTDIATMASYISSDIGTSMRCVNLPAWSDFPDRLNIDGESIFVGPYMTELFWWQCAALFWLAVCFFRVGAMTKRIPMSRSIWIEIFQAALMVVLVFALLTDARGCRSLGATAIELAPALSCSTGYDNC